MTLTLNAPSMNARRVALILLTVVALVGVYLVGASRAGGSAAAAPTQPSARAVAGGPGITVAGRANVAGTPDTLRLDLAVVASAPSVSAALAKANSYAAAVQKSLLAGGVAKKDLQTSGLNITPDYSYPRTGKPILKGYQVTESVIAKLRDLVRAGEAIGKAVGAGGSAARVNGISLDLEETGVLVSRARDKAFADAKAKAEQYAKAAGRSLGDVVSITETVATPSPTSMGYPQDAALSFKESVPIQPGSQNVGVTATVVFALR